MFNLGILYSDENSSTKLFEFLQSKDYNLSKIVDEEQLKDQNGLVIYVKEKNFLVPVIEWLLASRENINMFVWIFSEFDLSDEKKIMLSLGVNAIVSAPEEISDLEQIIKNTFSRLNTKIIIDERIEPEEILNNNSQSVYVASEEVFLTQKEYSLFRKLYENKNVVITYEDLSKEIWKNTGEGSTYRLSNIVCHLRKKMNGNKNFKIVTVRSKGYLLKPL